MFWSKIDWGAFGRESGCVNFKNSLNWALPATLVVKVESNCPKQRLVKNNIYNSYVEARNLRQADLGTPSHHRSLLPRLADVRWEAARSWLHWNLYGCGHRVPSMGQVDWHYDSWHEWPRRTVHLGLPLAQQGEWKVRQAIVPLSVPGFEEKVGAAVIK